MSDSNQNFTEAYLEQLLREGIAAAKSGDRMTARQKLRQVTELDQFNERGWFWLASVVETDEEKRVCLGNVVVINPNNEKAKQMLDQLIAGGKRGFDVTNTVGVALGRFNKLQPAQRVVVLLGAVAVAALLFFMLSMVGGGGSNIGAPTADSLYTPTTAAVAVQDTAVADTETPTPSETPTETPQRGPTLPPTWTREPTFTPVTRIKSTPLAAPPADALVGRMIVSIGLPLTLDKNLPLYLYNPKSKEITNLTTPERGDYGVFFPDGVRYAFSRYLSGTGSLQIRIVNLNGTQGRELSDTWGRNPVLADHRMITISANGMKIAFSAINKRENDSSPDIFVLPVFFPPASSTATPTTTPTTTLTPTSTLNPLVTPTETLTATPTTPPQVTLTATPVPALLQRLTEKDSGDNLWPSLSPDGSKLLYISDKQEFNGTGTDLYLVDLASGAQTNLTNDGQDQIEAAPRWSSDGTKIVFQAGASTNKTGIYMMDADGTNRQTLVEPNANNIRPVWSPDGQYVGFTSDLSGKLEIFLVEVATLTITQLTSMEDPITLNDWAN
ncbi:MAG: PD40 domain-containing protein [Anaerolineae bacterium]|nr:PD40 domain-containing protein [Anaerolineae bacterium]